MDRSRYHHSVPSPSALYTTLFFILLVSLSVFVLTTPQFTGLVTYTPQQPQQGLLLLDKTIYLEGESLTGDFDVSVPGPLSEQTLFTGTIDTQKSSLSLADALNASSVAFQVSPKQMTVQGASDSKTLVFPGKGSQQIFFSVPQGATVSRVSMQIHGQPINGSFPSSVHMDIGMDGSDEWEYLGSLVNYTNFILPSGLMETTESTTFVKDEDAYYCEIISLPRAKDFSIFAKYALDPSALAAGLDHDLEAVLLSLSGSGPTVQASGGADVCDLPESTNTTPDYQSCNLSVSYSFGANAIVSYAVQGNYLVCVHNEEYSTSSVDIYNLRRDTTKGIGYRCNALAQGKSTCTQQLAGDFYIKIQAGLYDSLLDRQVTLDDGYTQRIFEDELNSYISRCPTTDGNGNCIISLSLSSDSAGIIYFDQLQLRYDLGGSTSEENNFYDVSFTPGVIYSLDGIDLAQQNTTLSLSVDALNLVAPDPGSKSKNFTLTISLSPGTGDSETLLVQAQNISSSNTTTQLPTTTQELIDFYESLLSQLLQQHQSLLNTLQYAQKITQAIQQLGMFEQQLRGSSMNGTNGSSSSLDKQITALVQSLPQSVTLSLQSTHDFTASYTDLTPSAVLPEQRDESSRKKIATLQHSVSITGDADAYELVTFGGSKEEGTFLQIHGNSPFNDGYLVLLAPPSLGSLTDITFSVQPEIIQQANPAILRWPISQLSQGVSLLLTQSGIALDDLRAAIIPLTIPEEIPSEKFRCGDGVCTVLEINGKRIALEDASSCPVDCSTSLPWTPLIIIILLFLLAIGYFGFYHGKYSFQNLISKGKKPLKKAQTLFATSADEANLRAYIRTSLQRGQQKDLLVKNLLKQGWTQQQIDFILKTLQQR